MKSACIYCGKDHYDYQCDFIRAGARMIVSAIPSGKTTRADFAKIIEKAVREGVSRWLATAGGRRNQEKP